MAFQDPNLLVDQATEFRNRGRPEAGAMDILGASFESSRLDTTLFSRVRIGALEELHNTGPLISPEESRERFGLSTDRELSEQEALFISEVQAEERTRRATVQSASRSLLKGTILPFVGGIAGAISDPLDFAIGALTGGVAGAIGKKIGAKALTTFGIAAVENMIAGAITEVSVVQASRAELRAYTAQQAFFNVVAGSLAITGFVHGMKGGVSALSKMGRSHVNLGNKMAKMAEDNGLDAREVTNFLEAKTQEKLNLDDGIVKATHDALGEKAGPILDSVTDAKELVRTLNQKARDGEIEGSDIEKVKAVAEENGSPPERWTIVDEDSPVQFAEADIIEFQKKLESNEFKLQDNNPQATRENVKYEEVQIDAETEAKMVDIRSRVEADPVKTESLKKALDEADLDEESVTVVQKYLDCIGA